MLTVKINKPKKADSCWVPNMDYLDGKEIEYGKEIIYDEWAISQNWLTVKARVTKPDYGSDGIAWNDTHMDRYDGETIILKMRDPWWRHSDGNQEWSFMTEWLSQDSSGTICDCSIQKLILVGCTEHA